MAGSDYEFKFLPSAKRDLWRTISYIAEDLCNPKAARDLLDKIEGCITQICNFPESGVWVNNAKIADPEMRKVFAGNYIIFYKPDHKTQTNIIFRVLYGRRKITRSVVEGKRNSRVG